MGLIAPTLPDVDIDQWRALTRPERTRILAQHWAQFGFGTPKAIYALYLVKIILYVLGAMLFIAATPGIGSVGEWRDCGCGSTSTSRSSSQRCSATRHSPPDSSSDGCGATPLTTSGRRDCRVAWLTAAP